MTKQQKDYRIEGRPKTIYRVVKSAENPYVMIDRRPIDNATLSFKAKGILTYLMSRPDGWEVSVADLVNHATDGDDSIRSGLKELRDAGHMKYTKMRDKGRITGWLIEVYELPHADFPDVAFPDVAFPDVENPTQVLSKTSNKKRKKNEGNINLSEEEEESSSKSKSTQSVQQKKDRSMDISLSLEIEKFSKYWHEQAEIKPSKTLNAVLKRFIEFGIECEIPKGQIKSDLIDLIDRTFLNSPNYPEKYMITCLKSQQENYKRDGWSIR